MGKVIASGLRKSKLNDDLGNMRKKRVDETMRH